MIDVILAHLPRMYSFVSYPIMFFSVSVACDTARPRLYRAIICFGLPFFTLLMYLTPAPTSCESWTLSFCVLQL